MPPSTNAERQKRFRELTLKERQLKADAFELLLSAIEAKQPIDIPLPDGRQLKLTRRNGHFRVQLVVDVKLMAEMQRARLRLLYGD